MISNPIKKALVYGGLAALAATGAGLPAVAVLTRVGLRTVGKGAETIANAHNVPIKAITNDHNSESKDGNGRHLDQSA